MEAIENEIIRGLPPQLRTAVGIWFAQVAVTFVAGEITQNYSQVDRIWTFTPTLYTLLYTFYPLSLSAPAKIQRQGVQPRALIMSALQILWCLRLTWHSSRRGFFSFKTEDYRWPVMRDWVHKAPVFRSAPRLFLGIFNLGFIAISQLALLFGLGLFGYAASVSTEPLHTSDGVIAGLVLLAIATEFTADNQQYAYQTYKHSGKLNDDEWPGARIQFTPADRERGFITKGLWAYSRHPNVAAEQMIWFFMSLFIPLSKPHMFRNIVDMLAVLSPALSLSALVYASTLFTERISSPKYVAYKEYQRRVAMFWPTDTAIKALWLAVRGKKSMQDQLVWGEGVLGKKEE